MDNDIQRRQIFDELEAEFGTRLREAKQQKTLAEEELEAVSEKWRTERRKLNCEIDRLESSLTEAKETRKKSRDVRARGIDPAEVAKLQAAADEKLNAAAKAWDTQRLDLRTEISRLEHAVADALERSNNPLRVTAAIKLRMENQLEEAVQIKRHLEEESRSARESWNKEKLRLTGEIIKARQGAAKPVQGTEEDGRRIAELENRLTEATRLREASQRQLQETQDDWLSERKKLVTGFDLVHSRAQEAQLHDKGHREGLEIELSKARSDWQADRQALVAELEQARGEFEQVQLQDKQRIKELAQRLNQISATRDDCEHGLGLTEDLKNVAGDAPSDRLDAELVRVKTLIADLANVIDDPNTDLATVIRKNVERVELGAYLKGILFSLGRSTADCS